MNMRLQCISIKMLEAIFMEIACGFHTQNALRAFSF